MGKDVDMILELKTFIFISLEARKYIMSNLSQIAFLFRGRSFMTSATLGGGGSQPNSDICCQGGRGGQSKSDILLMAGRGVS